VVLSALTIRDIVLIEQAALEFAPGLNVMTGETGAGKSILLDSLGLAVGNRGRATVRAGAGQGAATAVFEPPPGHPARALLAAQDMESDGEIVLRRSLSADGKSRAFINDGAVGVGLLKDLGGLLLEVHGQQDDRGLFDAATHRLLLDAFGGLDAGPVAAAHAMLATARAALAELQALAAKAAADADFVKAAARELADFAPEAGEEEKLAATRALMMNASKLAEEIAAASDALSGERGAETSLAQALKRLSRLTPEARPLTAAAETALEQAYALAEEARRELDSLLTRLDTDTGALERAEERLFALRTLARKYAVVPDALPALADEYRAKEDALTSGGGQIKKAEVAVAEARAARHFRISRAKDRTKIEMLDDAERLEEIARMLSGAAVTEEARAAARRLMAEATKGPGVPPRKQRKRA
jgi:DNA repair protein RecN (Recombination protein N)